ncbi:IS1595 family transposase [Lysobacteraceae bacterium NML95-0200]|nr:IS1595 family transposase [Xanthomonadaceae bacterium NML95-0200]
MPSKNRYYRHSKISEAKFRRLLRLFAMDLTATDAAQLCGLSVRSVNAVYQRIRARLAQECAAQSPFLGELEADESYFGPKRIRGKRGRGAGGKTIVFGLLKRGDCVYTEIVPNASKATLQAIIRGKVDPNSIIHTDGWRGYDGLVDLGLEKHFRVNHGNNEFVKGARHVNGIESFWSYAKHRLAQFHGVRKDKFELHLKETEFRFNHRHLDLYKTLLKLLKDDPL